METLFAEGRITLTDLHSVYEALFLRAVTSFEVFLEDLFFSILKGKAKYAKARVSLRMTPSSHQALWEIIHRGDKYLKWIPFSNTEDRAKLYLNGGRPFSELSNADKSAIKTITIIRNAIAHKGSHALSQFKSKVIGNMALLAVEKRPAGFLRSNPNPAQRRFEVYLIQLAKIASDLT